MGALGQKFSCITKMLSLEARAAPDDHREGEGEHGAGGSPAEGDDEGLALFWGERGGGERGAGEEARLRGKAKVSGKKKVPKTVDQNLVEIRRATIARFRGSLCSSPPFMGTARSLCGTARRVKASTGVPGLPKTATEGRPQRVCVAGCRRRLSALSPASISSPYLGEGHHLDRGVGRGRNRHEGDGTGGGGDWRGGGGLRAGKNWRREDERGEEEGEKKESKEGKGRRRRPIPRPAARYVDAKTAAPRGSGCFARPAVWIREQRGAREGLGGAGERWPEISPLRGLSPSRKGQTHGSGRLCGLRLGGDGRAAGTADRARGERGADRCVSDHCDTGAEGKGEGREGSEELQ